MPVWTFASFLLFTGLVGLITYLLTRGDKHDTNDGYFLAGRSLTGGYIAGSLLLTNLSTEQLVGLNGAAYADGICVMAWEVIAAMSLVLLALAYLPRYLKSGIATVPQFLESRFDDGTRTITTIIFVIAYAGILLPIILYSGAKGMTQILDLEALTGITDEFTLYAVTVTFIGVIGSIYAIFGGLRTVAVSDTLNGFGLLLGGILIAYYGLGQVSTEGSFVALEELYKNHPEKFNSIGGTNQSVPFSTLFTGVLLLNLFYWTTNQQIIQRTFGAKNLGEAQKGVLMAGVFKMLAPLILVLPGIIAFSLYGTADVGGARVPVKDLTTEDVAVIVTTTDGSENILHGADAIEKFFGDVGDLDLKEGVSMDVQGTTWTIDHILGPNVLITVGANRENVFHRDLNKEVLEKIIPPRNKDNAYGRLVRDVLPPWMTGFFAAVVIGAILSSFNSVLNSTATLFSLGVYKHMFMHEGAGDAAVIRVGKIFGTVIAIGAMATAPMLLGADSLFGYLQKMNGLYFIPIFSVMLIGMTTKRVPAIAAKVALVVGFAAISVGYFVFPDLVNAIHEFHFLGIVFFGLCVLMLVIGNIAPMKTPYEQQYSGDVDLTPWPLAKPVGIALVVFVLTVYGYFADFSILSQ